MDYSKLSDAQLTALHSGDFSALSNDELASLHQEQSAESQKDPGFGPTADGHMRNPLDVDWVGAIKNEFTKEPDPSAKAAMENPLMSAFSPAVTAGAEALGAGAAAVASATGSKILNAAENFATSPLPQKISDATNMVGKAKGLAEKLLRNIGENLPESGKKTLDVTSAILGRKAAYSNPVTAFPQAVSDTAKLATKAQQGIAWVLDNAPEKLGKFAPVLKKAAALGGSALATTTYLLQQSDPEYQELSKKAMEGGNDDGLQ